MAEDYPAWRRAEGKIQIAIARLASKYLFHTKILERFRVRADAQHGGTAGGDTDRCGLLVDDHGVWEQARQDSERSEESVEGLIQDAIIEVGPAQVPEGLRNALRNLMIGDWAGDGVCLLGPPRRGRLDWQRLLRRHVGQILEVRPVFTRPPRRFPDLVGILPGRQRRGDRPKIMAVVDTSGSITPALLELINAELARLARSHAVTVVECDARIHSVYRYRPIRSVTGRGGTDLRPPFAPEFLREHRPDLIVYFTDGHGPVPDRPPRPPVIWCVTPQGKRPADWGRVVQMEAGEPGQHLPRRRRSVPKTP